MDRMMLGTEKSEQVLSKAWSAYRLVCQGIANLEEIGLAVDGAASKNRKDNMSVLFGAVTALTDAISILNGIEPGSAYAEQADMLIANLSDDKWPPEKFPEKLRASLRDVADTAEKSGSIPLGQGAKPFEVNVSMCGGITVYAAGADAAMDMVRNMPTDDILEKAAWDYPVPTDAHD